MTEVRPALEAACGRNAGLKMNFKVVESLKGQLSLDTCCPSNTIEACGLRRGGFAGGLGAARPHVVFHSERLGRTAGKQQMFDIDRARSLVDLSNRRGGVRPSPGRQA